MKKHIVLDHPIILSTVGIALLYLVMRLFTKGAGFLLQGTSLDENVRGNLIRIVMYLVTTIILVMVVKRRSNPAYRFFRNWNRSLEALVLLWPDILIAVLNLLPGLADEDPFTYQGLALFTNILLCLCIGLFEEVVFRGIVVSNSMRVWKENKNKVICTVILSGVSFGLMHLLNIFDADTGTTLLQVAYATGLGMIYASVYLRTENLFMCALTHGIVDVCGTLYPSSTTNITIFSTIFSLALAVLSILYSLFLLRKKEKTEKFESF